MGFIQQKQTDLRHMRPRGDMDIMLVFFVLHKFFLTTEIIQFCIDFLKIPGIAELNQLPDHFRIRRTGKNIGFDIFIQITEFFLIKQMIPVKVQVFLQCKSD